MPPLSVNFERQASQTILNKVLENDASRTELVVQRRPIEPAAAVPREWRKVLIHHRSVAMLNSSLTAKT
jgi:hypothetical protein